MEYDGALPAVVVLPDLSLALGARGLLYRPSVSRRPGNVFPRATLDRKSIRRDAGRGRLCVQRPHAKLPDVAKQYRRARLDAMGRLERAEVVERGRTTGSYRRSRRDDATAGGGAGDSAVHVGPAGCNWAGRAMGEEFVSPVAAVAPFFGCRLGERLERSSVVALLRAVSPFPSGSRICRWNLVDADLGVGEPRGPSIPLHSNGRRRVLSGRSVLDQLVLSRRGNRGAGLSRSSEMA